MHSSFYERSMKLSEDDHHHAQFQKSDRHKHDLTRRSHYGPFCMTSLSNKSQVHNFSSKWFKSLKLGSFTYLGARNPMVVLKFQIFENLTPCMTSLGMRMSNRSQVHNLSSKWFNNLKLAILTYFEARNSMVLLKFRNVEILTPALISWGHVGVKWAPS